MVAISDRTDIDMQQVLLNIGYGSDYKPPARIDSLVNDYVENAQQLIEPSYSYVIKHVTLVHGTYVIIDNSVVFQSNIIARLLEQCDEVAIFLVTIGSHLEEMVRRLAEDSLMLQASVLDAIGSAAVERVLNFVQDKISEVARAHGLCISRRFSPGHCDWEISQQKMLFQAMNSNSADVRLTEGCLMLPQKSISGIIGIGPRSSNIDTYNPCATCNRQDCPGRKQGLRI